MSLFLYVKLRAGRQKRGHDGIRQREGRFRHLDAVGGGRITFSGGGPNGIGVKEEFSATGTLQSDDTLVGDVTSATSGKLTWKAVRTVAR
jgi:hypothetical protein